MKGDNNLQKTDLNKAIFVQPHLILCLASEPLLLWPPLPGMAMASLPLPHYT